MAELKVTPEPTEEEVAAIVASIETVTGQVRAGTGEADVGRWRWSGRWWSKPIPARRIRPW